MPKKNIKKNMLNNENTYYCRKCMGMFSSDKFYKATNPLLDTNGVMSICKDCSNDLYEGYMTIYGNIEKAIFAVCEDLDIRFSKDALIQTLSHAERAFANNKNVEKIFGVYKSKLGSTSKENEQISSFRFRDSSVYKQPEVNQQQNIPENIDNKLKLFWGNKFSIEDLEYLEMELNNWQKTHKCDNHSELILIKEICIKQLEIRKDRDLDKPVTNKLDEFQKLMKTASLDPAKANVASAGKSQEAYGVWIKDIENFTPAEWYEDQEKYKDMDNFVSYLQNYIYRPIINFLTGSRNFTTTEDIDANIEDIGDGDE